MQTHSAFGIWHSRLMFPFHSSREQQEMMVVMVSLEHLDRLEDKEREDTQDLRDPMGQRCDTSLWKYVVAKCNHVTVHISFFSRVQLETRDPLELQGFLVIRLVAPKRIKKLYYACANSYTNLRHFSPLG